MVEKKKEMIEMIEMIVDEWKEGFEQTLGI